MSESQSITRYPHIINGEKREPGSGKYIPVFNPATNELIAEAAQGTPEDLDIAVHAAREAFNCKAWCNMPATERSRLLYAIANTVMANAQELAQLERTRTARREPKRRSLRRPLRPPVATTWRKR